MNIVVVGSLTREKTGQKHLQGREEGTITFVREEADLLSGGKLDGEVDLVLTVNNADHSALMGTLRKAGLTPPVFAATVPAGQPAEQDPAPDAGRTDQLSILGASGMRKGQKISDVERQLILETLTHCGGNRTWAADILGISIRTLRNKLQQYTGEGIPVTAPGERRMRLSNTH